MKKNYNILKIKLKKGDEVIVLKGKDKGKTGKILKIFSLKNQAVISEVHKYKKHQKPTNDNAGGIIEKEMPINISNIAFYDAVLKKGVKIGYKILDNGKKIRINRSSKKEIK